MQSVTRDVNSLFLSLGILLEDEGKYSWVKEEAV